ALNVGERLALAAHESREHRVDGAGDVPGDVGLGDVDIAEQFGQVIDARDRGPVSADVRADHRVVRVETSLAGAVPDQVEAGRARLERAHGAVPGVGGGPVADNVAERPHAGAVHLGEAAAGERILTWIPQVAVVLAGALRGTVERLRLYA